jgi:hypothetical protein
MGTLLPFPERSECHTLPVSQLQTHATTIATTLQVCVQVTACFQCADVSPAQCARAAAHLQRLPQQVQELYDLVALLTQCSANRYPVLIQAHHGVVFLEQTIGVIQEMRAQKANLHRYFPP